MKVEDVKYIKARIGVRYWEDSDVNGKEDIELMSLKEPQTPRMPFAVPNNRKERICPFGGFDWVITIDVNTGNIVGWPEGTKADVHYKSCDDNTITLIGDNDTVLGEYDEYVPNVLCPEDEGYGDYVIMVIDEHGHINDFKFGEDELDDIVKRAF